MGNETSKAIYEAKKIQNIRKAKLKIQKKQPQQLLNDALSNRRREFDQKEQGGQMLKKQKSQNSQQTQNQQQNMQNDIMRDQRFNLKQEGNVLNPYLVKRQFQNPQKGLQIQEKVIDIKREPQKVFQKSQHQSFMENENDRFQQKQGNLKEESLEKDSKQSIQFKWQSYILSSEQRRKLQNKKIKFEIIQISSDDSDSNDSNDQSDLQERSLSQIENIINEPLQRQNSQSQMIEENEERVRPQRRVKAEVKQNQQQQKIKLQYTQSKAQDIGVFIQNKQRTLARQKQLSEQQQLLSRLEQEFIKKAPLEPIFTQSNIQQKVYLKSIDILAVDFNYDLFVNVKELQQYQSEIRVKIMPEEDNANVMEEQKINDQFFMRQGSYANGIFNRRNNYIDYLSEGPKSLPDEYWFQLTIQDFKVGKGTIIQNTNLRYQGWQNKLSQYFKSLRFLLSKGIIQIQTTKIYSSPYQDVDIEQIYLNTRSSSTPQSMKLLQQKKQAQFSASFPLTFNLHNYYKFVIEQKLKKVNNTSEQKIFAISDYIDIFNFISQQLRSVLNFTNKSKWNETLKNSLLEKWKVFVQSHNEQQIKDEKKQQQGEQNDDMEYTDPPALNKQGVFKLLNQQINKEELQQLFESGKWFSLDSKKVPYVAPSRFFKGQLKQYQQLTLGWMLYRQNCPISYKVQRPIQHYLWTQFSNIGQNLYTHKWTHQIMNYLPVWKKNVNGGMLCDQMGLGKTVMALALIDKHIRERKFGIQRNQMQVGTLVIVPTTVLLQWQAKINEFLPHLNYLVVSKGKHITKQEVLKSHIVLTTFGIVRSQQKAFHKYQQFTEKKPQNSYTIYDFSWLRVIVDEADNLRNFKTWSAKSIQQISKQFTWLLTGTPIQNKLSDLQSYFNLLSFKQHGLIESSTKKGFIKSQKCLILLKQSLKDIMVRRKKDTLDEYGKPLLLLKEFKWIHNIVQFTEQQREIYVNLSQNIVKQIENVLKQDLQNQQWNEKMQRLDRKINKKKHQNIQHVFGKMMKLRQFCCHPQLFNSRSKFIKYEDFNRHFTYFCEKGYDMNAFKSYGKAKRKYMQDIFKLIFPDPAYLKKQQIKEKVYQDIMSRKDLICTSCSQVIRDGLITICLHPYCQYCFKSEWMNQSKNIQKISYGEKTIERRFMLCVDGNCQQKIFTRQILHLPRINRFNKKISEILPNKKIKKLIQEVQKTQPYEKIVIYTQFIGMIEILMQTFERESIKALNLTGKDSIQQRGDKIKAFKENESIKLLVISTKCGYAGLNLQFANKIYFMQPWWNPAVQDQALGRLHRYGQEKEVQSTRFIMRDSIEGIINLAGKQKKLLSDFVLDSDSFKLRKQKFEILKLYKRQLTKNISKSENNSQQKKQK